MCSVEKREQAVLSLRFEAPNIPPKGCNKPMENGQDTTKPDMYRCASASGRRQIPASRGVLNYDDPTYKTLPKPLQSLTKFAAICNYLTSNGCDGEMWWRVWMFINGDETLELDVMYGVHIYPEQYIYKASLLINSGQHPCHQVLPQHCPLC
jgi:hypothetical protein